MLPASSAAVHFLPFPFGAGVDSTPALRLCHVRSVRGPVVSASLLALARFISPLRIACAIRWGCSLLLLIVRVVSSRVAFNTSLCLQGLVVRASLCLCVYSPRSVAKFVRGSSRCHAQLCFSRPSVCVSCWPAQVRPPPEARPGAAGYRIGIVRRCVGMQGGGLVRLNITHLGVVVVGSCS